MNKFIEAMTTKDAYTANGALTNSTSLNDCLDFFSVAGSRTDLKETFYKAFSENPELAIRILFWSRDCRGGAGSRYNFILVMQSLQNTHPEIFSKIYKFIPEYGYWKDVFKLNPTQELIEFVAETLASESDHSLCAKFMPRKGIWFGLVRRELGMEVAQFRHFIVAKTQVVEQLMCANKWSNIDYSTVPSIASLRYSNIFRNHDQERYDKYIQDVNSGKEKINSDVLYPGDIYNKYFPKLRNVWFKSEENTLSPDTIRALWSNIPDYMVNCKENILPVCDTSGSMYDGIGTIKPIDVSVGLGVYIAERNKGDFHNFFMTFSEQPECIQFIGDDVIDHFEQLNPKQWGFSTNLQSVFDCLLTQAKRHNLKEEDMPTKLLLISDMQFNNACLYNESTNFEEIERKYSEAGYKRPGIVFWNVNGSAGNLPATLRDKNIALISGYSPAIITSVLNGEFLDPIQIMLKTVNSERYNLIKF